MKPQVIIKMLSGLFLAIMFVTIMEYYPKTIPYFLGLNVGLVVSFSLYPDQPKERKDNDKMIVALRRVARLRKLKQCYQKKPKIN